MRNAASGPKHDGPVPQRQRRGMPFWAALLSLALSHAGAQAPAEGRDSGPVDLFSNLPPSTDPYINSLSFDRYLEQQRRSGSPQVLSPGDDSTAPPRGLTPSGNDPDSFDDDL